MKEKKENEVLLQEKVTGKIKVCLWRTTCHYFNANQSYGTYQIRAASASQH